MRVARLACVAAALILWSGWATAEPTISIMNSAMTTEFRGVIDRLVSRIETNAALAARSADDTPAMYLDLNGALDSFPDFESLGPEDQALLRATKQTYELFRALGGELLDRFAMLQRRDNRYYIAVDGEGGRWVVTVEQALSVLLEELVAAETHQNAIAASGSQCSGDLHCLMLATYMGMIESAAYVSRNTTVTLEITGEGLGGGESAPMLLAPDSMVVHEVSLDDGGIITATVSVHENAPLGMNILSVYNEGHAFRSVARFGVEVMMNPGELATLGLDSAPQAASADRALVLVGSGDFQPLIDDHSAMAASATPLAGSASGRLVSTTDADLFKITVENASVLLLTSQGPTDVMGTLETDEGIVIAADDDSGARYNFSIEQAVAPGTYYLRVTHCCAGLGEYRLSLSITPN